MDGIINVNKESGMTSFDVLRVLKRILHEKKMGHAGTLDPMADETGRESDGGEKSVYRGDASRRGDGYGG